MRTDKELEGVTEKKTCGKCGKNYVSVSNLNRHLLKCLHQERFICEYCKHEFTQKYNLTTHLLICKSYEYFKIYTEEKKKYEDEISILKLENINLREKLVEITKEKNEYFKLLMNNKKTKVINNTTNNNNNISIINITIEDLNAKELKIHDLMNYGNSIANYVLNSTELQEKIKLRDRARKLIEYSIEDKNYNDKGRKLIIFIVKNYEDKIIKLLKDTYGADLDEMSTFNEHLNRLKNIRDNEMREIIIEERTDNQLGKEIFETLIENLNKDCEIKYLVKE
jgi:hypothetical protein